MEESFRSIADAMHFPEDVRAKSWDLWSSLKAEVCLEMTEVQGFYCCCLYITSVKCSSLLSDPVSVTDLVQAAKVDVPKFLACMRRIREARSLGDEVKRRFINLEKRYCISVAIFDKLKQLIKQIFEDDEVPLNAPNDQEIIKIMNKEGMEYKTKLIWLLFLLASDQLNSECELILAYNILLCCAHAVISATPSFRLKAPFDEMTDVDSRDIRILEELCDPSVNSLDEVMDLSSVAFKQFLESIQAAENIFDIDHLERLYVTLNKRSGSFNELEFLRCNKYVIPYSFMRHDTAVGVNLDYPVTPIRAVLNSLRSLKKLLREQTDTPSDELLEYFKNCSVDPSRKVLERVAVYRDKFVSALSESSVRRQRYIAPQQYKLTVSFYYRVLHSLLAAEEERLREKDFTSLLNKDEFHLSLLACSAEIVITTYSVSWNTSRQMMDSGESDYAFPWILGVFDLKAFYFYKVLESVIKAEPYLPKEIIRHLQGVENCILESIAWEEDSPLYEQLSKDEVQQITFVPMTPTKLSQPPTASPSELYASPRFKIQSKNSLENSNSSTEALTCTVSSSAGENGLLSPRKSLSLNLFFNKVRRLGYHRLQALCSLLNLSDETQRKIWTCFDSCILKEPWIFKNRHVDQIMMCSIYGVCKVSDIDMKFKLIVNVYKTLPHASMQTYRSVLTTDGCHDSIVEFYNRIFSQVMKCTILQFSKSRTAPELSPVPKVVNSLLASPYSIPGKPNFRVSPMKRPFKMPESPSQMTPRSRMLYCFGDGIMPSSGSAEKLRKINERIAEGSIISENTQRERKPRKLKFDSAATQYKDMKISEPIQVTRSTVAPE